MTKAKLFYFGHVEGRIILNIQEEATGTFEQIEISRAQLRNMLIDGMRILVMDTERGKATP